MCHVYREKSENLSLERRAIADVYRRESDSLSIQEEIADV